MMKRTIGIFLAAVACTAVVGAALYFGYRAWFASLPTHPDVVTDPGAKTAPDDADTADPAAYRPAPVSLSAAASMLFTAKPPRQIGAEKHALQRRRAAVLRGKVLSADGKPLAGVEVAVPTQPEVGRTRTNADGAFDLAVNGGGPVVIAYTKEGFLPARRMVAVPWQDYAWLPEVVLVPPGGRAGALELSINEPLDSAAVVRGGRVEDADGPRQPTLLAPPGFGASLVLSAGIKPLNRLTLSLTEYTVGPRSASALPAAPPPGAGCGYAVEIAADEAREPGAHETRFRIPLIHYVENFLKLPVGAMAPTFRYDPEREAWAPGTPGRVVRILDVKDGLADVDLDGKGEPADAAALAKLQIGDPERRRLAALYPKDATICRLPLTSLGTWAVFPVLRPPDGAVAPPLEPASIVPQAPAAPKPGPSVEAAAGTTATVESVKIPGTDLQLCYSSDRAPGTKSAYKLAITLSGPVVPMALKRIDLEVQIAGARVVQSFPAAPGQTTTFAWDGLDAYGRPVSGRRPALIRVGYAYDAVPPARQECILWRERRVLLGDWDARAQALGGWTLSILHAYDPVGRVLHLGGGMRREGADLPPVVATVAGGTGVLTFSADDQPAVLANLSLPRGLAVGLDGSLYIADAGQNRVRRVGPDGLISTVAGTGRGAFERDDGVAREEPLNAPMGLAVGPDGSVYIADDRNNRVRRLGPDGVLSTIVGGGDKRDDGALARAAQVGLLRGVAVGPGGDVFLAQNSFNQCVVRVQPNGVLRYVVGGPAGKANLETAAAVATAPDGTVYVADADGCRVWRVAIDGAATPFAGTGAPGFSGDGGPAVNALLNLPSGLAVGPDGSLYIADAGNQRVRRVAPDGLISTFAGRGKSDSRETGDGGPASMAVLRLSEKPQPGQGLLCGLAVGPEGEVYIADVGHGAVRRVAPAFGGISDSEILLTSDDGSEVYVFDGVGRHLKTLDGATGAVLYRFVYDAAWRLMEVHDRLGGVTRIERDKAGRPRGLVAWDGGRTTLETGADDRLSRIGLATGDAVEMEYDGGGLLTSFKDAQGHAVHFRYDDDGRPHGE